MTVPLFRPTVVVSAAPSPTRIVVLSVACPARLITLAVPWLASPVREVNRALSPSEKKEFAAVLLIVKGWPGNVPLTWIVPRSGDATGAAAA